MKSALVVASLFIAFTVHAGKTIEKYASAADCSGVIDNQALGMADSGYALIKLSQNKLRIEYFTPASEFRVKTYDVTGGEIGWMDYNYRLHEAAVFAKVGPYSAKLTDLGYKNEIQKFSTQVSFQTETAVYTGQLECSTVDVD